MCRRLTSWCAPRCCPESSKGPPPLTYLSVPRTADIKVSFGVKHDSSFARVKGGDPERLAAHNQNVAAFMLEEWEKGGKGESP